MTSSIEEQLESIRKREAQLKARRQRLLARQTHQERKARTRRLIEKGAILEKALESTDGSPEYRKALEAALNERKTFRDGTGYTPASLLQRSLERIMKAEVDGQVEQP